MTQTGFLGRHGKMPHVLSLHGLTLLNAWDLVSLTGMTTKKILKP